MKTARFARAALLSAALILIGATGGAYAQWPAKPVHVVVPYPPGGGVDSVARVVTPYLSRFWGQPVIIDNRPGAGGHVGAEFVSRSAPDGQTLLMTASGQAAGPALYKKLNYDPINGLVPIAGVVAAPNILVATNSLPASSVKEFIALAKARPGKLNYASTGVGSGPNLSFELLKSMAGINVVHVPYKGDALALPAMIANEVQVGLMPPQTAIPLLKSGKLKALALSSLKRFQPMADLPTIAEEGVPGYEYIAWVAAFAPGGTPRTIVDRINADIVRTMKEPEFVNKYLPEWGQEAMSLSANEFAARYLKDIETYKRIVREAGIPQID